MIDDKRAIDILTDIHEQYDNKRIMSNSFISQDKKNAHKLQVFFNSLLNELKKPSNNIQKNFIQDIAQQLLQKNPNILQLFNVAGVSGGFNFEQGLSQMISTTWETLGNQSFNNKDFVIGANAASVGITLQTLTTNYAKGALNSLSKEFGKSVDELKSELLSTVARSGKIDVIGGTTITQQMNISYGLPDEWSDIPSLLNSGTFSLKSYTGQLIHLGNSNLIKAIFGASNYITGRKGLSAAIAMYGINTINANKTEDDIANVRLHINHLRMIYELTGSGLIYKNFQKQFFEGAKYFIVNEPGKNNIMIRSTAAIIDDVIFKEQGKMRLKNHSIYTPIEISMQYIKESDSGYEE